MGCSCCKCLLHYACSQPKQQGIHPLLGFARWVCQGLQDSWVLALTACVIMAALDQAPHSNVGPIKGPPSSGSGREQSVKDLVDICVHSPQVEVWQVGLRAFDHGFTNGRLSQHKVVGNCLVGDRIVHPPMAEAPKTSPSEAPNRDFDCASHHGRVSCMVLVPVCPKGDMIPHFWAHLPGVKSPVKREQSC